MSEYIERERERERERARRRVEAIIYVDQIFI